MTNNNMITKLEGLSSH